MRLCRRAGQFPAGIADIRQVCGIDRYARQFGSARLVNADRPADLRPAG